MDRREVYKFLDTLTRNNSKEWMDANRAWYHEVKAMLTEVFDPILEELKHIDPRIVQPNARKAFNRINNNLMFHPERPVYKDHFGLGFGYGKGLADFYIQLGAQENVIAGGLWHPHSDKLKKLRSEIDYEGDRLAEMLSKPSFERFQLFQEDKLKASPKGFSKDHPHIELLRMKSLGAWINFNRKDFLSKDFKTMVIKAYRDLVPMLDFINVAISEEEFPSTY